MQKLEQLGYTNDVVFVVTRSEILRKRGEARAAKSGKTYNMPQVHLAIQEMEAFLESSSALRPHSRFVVVDNSGTAPEVVADGEFRNPDNGLRVLAQMKANAYESRVSIAR